MKMEVPFDDYATCAEKVKLEISFDDDDGDETELDDVDQNQGWCILLICHQSSHWLITCSIIAVPDNNNNNEPLTV